MAQAYEQSLLPVFRASSTIRRMLVLPGYVRKPVLSFLESSPAITELPGAQDALRSDVGRERLRSSPRDHGVGSVLPHG